MVPAGLLLETEGEGADQLGCAAETESRSVASCGLCNLTPDLSTFRGLYNGPWGAGTQVHLGQQKVRLTRPPTSPGYRAGKGGTRRAECGWHLGSLAGCLNRQTHTHTDTSPVTRGGGRQTPRPLRTPQPQSTRPPLPSGTCHHILTQLLQTHLLRLSQKPGSGGGRCIFSFESSIKSQ